MPIFTCVEVNSSGLGILKDGNLTYTYKDCLVGETFLYEHAKNKIKILKRLTDSKDRVNPFCKYYDTCGGCQIQHMSYANQLKFKKETVINDLKMFFVKTTVNDTIEDKDQTHYRNKLITTYKPINRKQFIAGMYEENTHKVVKVVDCPIQNKLGNKVIKYINGLLIKHKVEAFDEDKRTGVLRHILIRVGVHTNEVLVCLVSGQKVFPGINNLLKDITKEPSIKSVYLNINERKSSAVLSNNFKHLYGSKYIKDELLGLTFMIGPDTFYQINPDQTKILYKHAIETLELSKEDDLLDCYSGIGTITLSASKHAKSVTGVEYNHASTEMAIENAKVNKITNAKFYTDDATTFILRAVSEKKYYSKIIVDPPRMGLDKAFIEAVIKMKPKRFTYVSCNPATLSRDLSLFEKDYIIESVTPLDMFPQTYHVECVASLRLK